MVNSFVHINPLRMAREVQDRYHGYLKTSFYFRDPELRRSFESELEQGRLVNGPFLESMPVYARETTTCDLLREILTAEVDPGFVTSLDPRRMLYVHQERAIRRLAGGHNVVVATGTGSGKTESYLLPILCALYLESLAGERTPGVRALILYPMNALANDQRRRLGELAKRLRDNGSRFSFTFGRYTGETPEDERDSGRNVRQHLEDRKDGELVLRSEMRARPPDILLTNYSMLEYLLLRPDDSPLFDDGRGATWRFCVLDEAHQYRGTKGMEMAMLLRRLKQRLHDGGLRKDLQCIATSASLGGGEDNRVGLAAFAQELFGATFTEDDVILEKVAEASTEGSIHMRAEEYSALSRAIDSGPADAERALRDLASRHGVSFHASSVPERLYQLLPADSRLSELRRLLRAPQQVETVKNKLFEELAPEDRDQALEDFLGLVTSAHDSASAAPLLGLRYHLFLRALEGAFVSYWPAKRVWLARAADENLVGGVATTGKAFEVALCRECGQHYFVGRREGGYLREALRDYGNDAFSVSFFRPITQGGAGEEETKISRLCVRCGAICRPAPRPADPPCRHDSAIDVIEERLRDAAEDQMRTCGACGYRGPDPVREIVHGNDGPNAVVATAIHRCLPKDRRKVLGFVDGRQDAAFFAWYLQRSYESVLARNLLLTSARALAQDGYRDVSLSTLAGRARKIMRGQGVIPASADDLEALKRAWVCVFREFVSDEPRIALEGVGLVHWFPVLPDDLRIPDSLFKPPWSLDDAEAKDLLRWLLDSIRTDFAMELRADPGVNLSWGDLGLSATQAAVEVGGGRNVKAWDGPRTRRAMFLNRVLATRQGAPPKGPERVAAAQQLLREVWESFKTAGGAERILLRVGDAQRANPTWWRLRLLEPKDRLYRCETCGRYQALSVHGICARHACPGRLLLVSDATDITHNHYRRLYEQELPPRLRAEEHTAQIEQEQARTFQEDFEKGDIHFLSCSTTFELGVDLGDLDTIFLRNAPPEPFNYAQRVGRAGRRVAHPGFAVTYCRRRPHDLTHFQDPEALLAGRTVPPPLRVTNEKIVLRHVTAVVLSEFFRTPGNRQRFDTVETFLGNMTQPRAVSDIASFLQVHRAEVEGRLRRIVPGPLHIKIGLHDGSWVQAITDPNGRLAIVESEVSSDYRKVEEFEEEARNARRYSDADWARRRAETIAGEDVISFLSRKAVIPKYGFPVDVVELDLQRSRANQHQKSSTVSLQRDLSIAVAEFAPGCKLVANKKLWTSYGLKRVAEREWGWREYLKCSRHGTFVSWEREDSPPQSRCCNAVRRGRYVDPLFGFITERKAPEDPSYRPARVYSTRPYFLGPGGVEPDTIEMGSIASVRKAAPGRLVVLCEGRKGQGFLICPKCGAGVQDKSRHRTPVGSTCDGLPERVALGHEFVTDVLRIRFQHPRGPVAAPNGLWFGYSLAYALLQGAHEVLEVPLQDLSVTIPSTTADEFPEIVLYDDVPGGAGLVARLESPSTFRRCLEKARDRVGGSCGCAADTSCYGCLRSFANQFAHPRLTRGPVFGYLDGILAEWKLYGTENR